MKYAYQPIKKAVTSSNQFQLHESFVRHISFIGGDVIDKSKVCWYIDEGDTSQRKVVIADDDFNRPGFEPVVSSTISGVEPDEINESAHDNPRVTIPIELENKWYDGAISDLSDIDEVLLIGIPRIDQNNSCVVVEPLDHDNNCAGSAGLRRIQSKIPDDNPDRVLKNLSYELYL